MRWAPIPKSERLQTSLSVKKSSHTEFSWTGTATDLSTDPARVNTGNFIQRSNIGTSGIRFCDLNFSSVNNSEKGAIGYGNPGEAAPYGGVTFVGSSDLSGVAPFVPTTLVPIRLVQYGKIGSTSGDFGVVDLDATGNVNFWGGIWGSKTINASVIQGGGFAIGSQSLVGTEKFLIKASSSVYTQFFGSAGGCAMVSIGQEQSVQSFKDTTPTKAWSIGNNSIGSGVGNDMVFSSYTGSAWVEGMRLDNSGNFSVGTAALATNAANGFLYIATCAGTPTGTPAAKTGLVAIIYDTSANKIWVYNGAWRGVAVA